MIIAGGCYIEICLRPDWRRLFGSGLRAAAAVARLSPETRLHTYATSALADDVRHSAHAFGAHAEIAAAKQAISFSYLHPMSAARMHPSAPAANPPLSVKGATVLRFGFVEGDVVVEEAERAIYDPQGSDSCKAFGANGSRAKRLAVVLNEHEVHPSFQRQGAVEGRALIEFHGAEVAVVKRGPRGAIVHKRDGATVAVPAYRSERVFKIGSGDVFSASFAYHWGELGLDAVESADRASRHVAAFVDGHALPLADGATRESQVPVGLSKPGRIYLAGPFFDLPQRWLVEEALEKLVELGAEVFSPLHEVGVGLQQGDLAEADLAGLAGCDAVLALLDGMDPGTLFEVGYARARGLPVVALVERGEPENLTMIVGSGCEVVDDFATALYRAVWASAR